jgi:TM2 domain-containing membrane protein YozV
MIAVIANCVLDGETKTASLGEDRMRFESSPSNHEHRRMVWNPYIAAFLSLVVPGLGQIYKGQYVGGILWLIFTAALYVLIVPGLVLHAASIFAAYEGDPYQIAPGLHEQIHPTRFLSLKPH